MYLAPIVPTHRQSLNLPLNVCAHLAHCHSAPRPPAHQIGFPCLDYSARFFLSYSPYRDQYKSSGDGLDDDFQAFLKGTNGNEEQTYSSLKKTMFYRAS